MFRSIGVVLLVALALRQATAAIDVSMQKKVPLEFTDSDSVTKTKGVGLADFPFQRGSGFIGDLTIGQRFPDELVFRRVLELNNPTNTVQSTVLNLSVASGTISYISARNAPGSYVVVCDEPNSLGSYRTSIKLRAPPNSVNSLTLTVAGQNSFRFS